jgi:hypothetical protein
MPGRPYALLRHRQRADETRGVLGWTESGSTLVGIVVLSAGRDRTE